MSIVKNLIFLTFLLTKVYSHPHIFIEVEPLIKIEDEKIDKFSIKWVLDEMTSAMLIMEFDNDRNGKFDNHENTYIYENYFLTLENQNFYMKILSNKNNIFINPKNFKASIEHSKLVYNFDIDQIINIENLKIKFKDNELFVAMMLKRDYIEFTGIDKINSDNLKRRIFGIN